MSLFNKNYNKSGSDITLLKSLHIVQLLKEQRMYDEVSREISSDDFYDMKPQNGVLFSLYAFMTALIPVCFDDFIINKSSYDGSSFVELSEVKSLYRNGFMIGMGKGIVFSMAVAALWSVGKGYHQLKNREDKIDRIDQLIKKIETMQAICLAQHQ